MWTNRFRFGYENWMGLQLAGEHSRVLEEERQGYLFGMSMYYNGLNCLISVYDHFLDTQPTPEEMLKVLHEVWGSHFCPTLNHDFSCDEDQCPFCLKEET